MLGDYAIYTLFATAEERLCVKRESVCGRETLSISHLH